MPQFARIESPGSLFHIMAHSIEGKPMFIDDQDRLEFLSRFEKGLTETGFLCYNWALMGNHYHLFIRTNDKPLSKLMRGLNGGYATYYNKRHDKNGCLFQGRFKSVLCQDQMYAVNMTKYISLNPLRAGIVNSLEELKNYEWCGHGFLLGDSNSHGKTFQKREDCLRRFGDNEKDAIKAYLQFLVDDCKGDNKTAGLLSFNETTEIKGSCKGWPAVIGDPDFAIDALERFKESLHRKHREADYPYLL
ncbi:MAG TPA: transposase, partial [Chitinispirillaceae bacterium]|nr:transposase [Chitinispirillaceae bacterium]